MGTSTRDMTMNSAVAALLLVTVVAGQDLSVLDKNGNGFLDQDEMPGDVPASAFNTMKNLMDSNKDGKISLAEYQAGAAKQQQAQGNKEQQAELGLQALDSNGDGLLERSELPGPPPKDAWDGMLKVMDKNGDQKLSLEEYKAGMAMAGDGGGKAGGKAADDGKGGASSLTVATSMMSMAAAMWMLW